MCYNNINSNNNNNNNININNDKQIMSNNSDSNNIINSNSIKDNFRTPLTPLHRGGLEGLHKLRLDRFCGNTLRYAFSLIELSIVLIIIGLLVAGVTGGKSLIESAKTRALMNEIRNYNQAFTTFYVANGRLPGDVNRDGRIDMGDNDFYDFKDKDKYIEILLHGKDSLNVVAPWVELYDERIIDFKPPIGDYSGYTSLDYYKASSKVFKGFLYDIFNGGYDYDGDVMDNMDDNGKVFLKLLLDRNNRSYDLSTFIKINSIRLIDEKMDDGVRDTGRFKAMCSDVDDGSIDYFDDFRNYQEFVNGGCRIVYYALDIN